MFPRLKHATAQYHTQLETIVAIDERVRSPNSYRALLRRFYGFYAPLETRLACVDSIEIVDFAARRKVPLLQNDLRFLGMTDTDRQRLPLCNDLPTIDDLPSAFGGLYVVEGATLGGQLIARQLHALGLDADHGAAFFNSYRENVGVMWLNFKRAVDAQVVTAQDGDRTIASAQQTFIKLRQWLQTEDQTDAQS